MMLRQAPSSSWPEYHPPKGPIAVLFVIAALCFWFAMSHAEAREISFGNARVSVLVPFGVESIFRLPTDVKTVTEANRFEIKPADAENPDYSMLIVKPRFSEGTANVNFLLNDGTVLRTELNITKAQNLDPIVDFKPKAEMPSAELSLDSEPASSNRPRKESELDLMRALIRGDQIHHLKMRIYDQPVDLGTESVSARLVRVYEGHRFNGYVYRLEVKGSKQFEVDLSALNIGSPNKAIVSHIDRRVIGGETDSDRVAMLHVVAKKGASQSKHVLPMEIKSPGSLERGNHE